MFTTVPLLSALLIVILRPEAVEGESLRRSAGERRALADAASSLRAEAERDGEVGVIVQLKVHPDASNATVQATADQLIDRVGPDEAPTVLGELGVVTLQADVEDIDALVSSDVVAVVQPDEWLKPALNDTTRQIGAQTAWANGLRGAGQAVAVLDSGVDSNHPALRGKVVYEACFSNGSCPNGQSTQTGAGAARPCGSPGAVLSGCEHGTHVAGVIASGDATYPGVAPDAGIVAIQVFSQATGATCGGQTTCPRARTSDVLAALNRLVEVARNPSLIGGRKLVAANLSLSSDVTSANCDDSVLKSAVDNLWAANVATIVAAGNSGDPSKLGIPACISSTVSVGAVTKADAFWPVSNTAATLDLLAPGVQVTSTWPGANGVWGFAPASGTSTAAPHVAAAWAVAAQGLGTTSPASILGWLQSNGRPIQAGSWTLRRVDVSNLRRQFVPMSALTITGDMTAVVGDYDGNRYSDIYWYDPTGAQSQLWWYGPGGYTVQRSAMGGNWRPVAGDFNGDGIDDMFWYSPSVQSWFWWGRANGAFVGDGPYAPYGNFTPIAGDFNGDGFDDIHLYGKAGGPSYYYWMGPDASRPGSGRLIGFGNAPNPGPGFTPSSGDIDDNGADDILWYSPASSLMYVYAAGGVYWQGFYTSGAYAPALGRFDGVKGDDVLWYRTGTSWVWAQMCCGWTHIPVQIDAGDATPIAGDFDADGRDEVIFYGKGNNPDMMFRSVL